MATGASEKSKQQAESGFRRSARFLHDFLIAPRSSGEDQRRREYILNIILVASILLLCLLGISVFYYSLRQGQRYEQISTMEFSAIVLLFLCIYILSRKGYVRTATAALISVYAISLGYGAYRWGVDLPAVVLGYALLVTMSGILIGTVAGFATTALVGLFIVVRWGLQFHGLVPPVQPQVPNGSDGLVLALLLMVIMVTMWLSNREIERSLARARHSEKLLEEEKAYLEIKVKERTRQLLDAQSQKIEQLHRFADFGKLAMGIFHDLTNALGTLTLAEHGAAAPGRARVDVEEVRAAGQKIEKFAWAMRHQMQQDPARERFGIVANIEQVIQLLGFKARRAEVTIRLRAREETEYFGVPVKFQRVIMNLISNAIEAFESAPQRDERLITVSVNIAGGMIRVAVEDNGCGMPQAVQERLFEPFFSTKHNLQREGLGIGLNSVRRIVEEDFRGTLAVTSQENEGSCFSVEFPAVLPPVAVPPAAAHSAI